LRVTEARTSGVAKYCSGLVALQQVGQPGEVVVVGMGVEDARHLLLADAQRIEAVMDVRPGIDQIHPALMDQHAAHRRAVEVPAVAVAGMDHGEVMAIDATWLSG
jgi:hypothetical protein